MPRAIGWCKSCLSVKKSRSLSVVPPLSFYPPQTHASTRSHLSISTAFRVVVVDVGFGMLRTGRNMRPFCAALHRSPTPPLNLNLLSIASHAAVTDLKVSGRLHPEVYQWCECQCRKAHHCDHHWQHANG